MFDRRASGLTTATAGMVALAGAVIGGSADARAQSGGAAALIGNTFKSSELSTFFDPSGQARKAGDVREGKWFIEAADRMCVRANNWAPDRKECMQVTISGTKVTLKVLDGDSNPLLEGELLTGNPLGL